MSDSTISLPPLPDFPQLESVPDMFGTLWAFPEVRAIWIGGSFAAGTADRGSDVDIRVVVDHDAVDNWRATDRPSIFGAEYVEGQTHDFTGNGILHHFMGAKGTIYDLWVLDYDKELPGDTVLLLACRDDALAERIAAVQPIKVLDPPAADPSTIRRVIADYWITTSKDLKVIDRGLETIAIVGLDVQRNYLLRLWYTLATGRDPGTSRLTIHLLSLMVPPIRELIGSKFNDLYGAPTRNVDEIVRSIEQNRDEVTRVGRLLAENLGFEYPAHIEEIVRRKWTEFRGR